MDKTQTASPLAALRLRKWALPTASLLLLLAAIAMANRLANTIISDLIETRAVKITTEFTNELTKSLNPFQSDGTFSNLDKDAQKAILLFSKSISHIDRLIIINAKLNVVYDSLGQRVGQTYSDHDLLRAVRTQQIVTKKDKSAPNPDDGRHSPYIYEAYSPIIENGQVLGILELYYDAGDYAETIQIAADLCLAVFAVISFLFTILILSFYTKTLNDKEKTLQIMTQLRNDAEQSSMIAQESLARQKRFIANAAHELRTPLSILKARLDGLARFEGQTALAKDVDRLAHLMDQLLSIAILDSRRVELSEVIALNTICKAAIGDLVPLALNEGKQIAFDDRAAHPFMLRCNSFYLALALRNVIENAIRYTPAAGLVDVILHADGTLDIGDRGPGIEAELRDQLFEPFTQGGARKGKAGLGLAIVAETIALHGGTVSALPRDGGGSVFRIVLPPADDVT